MAKGNRDAARNLTVEDRKRGGSNSGGNFARDTGRASRAGRKGGRSSGGNFAKDRRRARIAGSKGGRADSGIVEKFKSFTGSDTRATIN